MQREGHKAHRVHQHRRGVACGTAGHIEAHRLDGGPARTEFDAERMGAAASDPLLLATDTAEALVASGTAFRDAHEQVAAGVHDGSYTAPGSAGESVAARPAPGPGGAAAAAREMRERLAEGR